jgi:hypothetical protein
MIYMVSLMMTVAAYLRSIFQVYALSVRRR